ncbi:MAG: hypothetical protein RI981_453 [Bacteroidota bacterium]|jgi:Secretion system C-terminal sorting domain
MKFYSFVFVFFASISCVFAQSISSSTIAAGGGTQQVNGKYFSQVIGQSSVVTGTSIQAGVTMRQGFKQPNLLARSIQNSGLKIQMSIENPITFTVFPNPFKDKLRIEFSAESTMPTYVAIYDIVGSTMWQATYPEKILEINLTEFQNFRQGKYILHVLQKGKPFVTSIVKE